MCLNTYNKHTMNSNYHYHYQLGTPKYFLVIISYIILCKRNYIGNLNIFISPSPTQLYKNG